MKQRPTGELCHNVTAVYMIGISNTASADALLVTELACLHCAKSHIADFVWEKSYENVFIAASHHKDEQVSI